jgi:hypothetical protein
MKGIASLALLALTIPALGASLLGDFCPGTGAEVRSSPNYLIADTLGQFVVGESFAPDESYACGWVEHGFWHSDIHIPSISEIKETPNNYWVDAHAKVVTAGSDRFYREFFIAEQDRAGAIRVNLGANPLVVSAGDMLDVSGIIKGTAAGRYIDYPVVTPRFPNALSLGPFLTPNNRLGGVGTDIVIPGGAGLLNTSILMKTTGRVTYVDTAATPKFFYVDDGSNLSDGQVIGGKTMRGLRVSISNLASGNTITPPSVEDYVAVTGICSTYAAGGKTLAQIGPRCQADVQVVTE